MDTALAISALEAKSMLLPNKMLFLALVVALPTTILLPIAITSAALVIVLLVPDVKTWLVFLTVLSAPLTEV